MVNPIVRLRDCLESGTTPEISDLPKIPNIEYAIDRFLKSFSHGIWNSDQIVLLRQLLRWYNSDITIQRPKDFDGRLANCFSKANLEWSSSGSLKANPYTPDWLESGKVEVDKKPKYRGPKESEVIQAENYVKTNLDFDKWLSISQKEATWETITTPPGFTNITVLPTGCGKSTSFWILPTINEGLTVVIVPTIALAIDQCKSAIQRYKNLPQNANPNPLYFASDETKTVVVSKLKNKVCRLVFTSPETCVSGVLRSILDKFAKENWFQNLVVDEVHLIETWGAQFRVEFQLLGAMCKRWKSSNLNLRTFLYSATISPECKKTLKKLFCSNEEKYQEYISQRLRPEMEYFSNVFQDNSTRQTCLLEAIWNLPRPVIIYYTEPKDAEKLCKLLIYTEGFKRVGCFTGETKRDERSKLISLWKDNEIDLMIATSAFGVGMDKSDVRTIIHACYPENLDRYYQEAGRSGRDNYSSICLLIPSSSDKKKAEGLSIRLLSAEKVQERWNALIQNSNEITEEQHTYELALNSRGINLIGTRTFTENINWNKRLLLMLHRAGRLEILNLDCKKTSAHSEEFEEFITVRLINTHPDNSMIGQQLLPERDQEKRHFSNMFKQVNDIIKNERCISKYFKNLYDLSTNELVCGGCSKCRNNSSEITQCPTLKVPHLKMFATNTENRVVEDFPNFLRINEREDFVHNLERIISKYEFNPLRLYIEEKYLTDFLAFLKRENIPHYSNNYYRIDSFKDDTVIRNRSNQAILFIHFKQFNPQMLELSQRHNSTHLFCRVNNFEEPNGKHIKIRYNLVSFPNTNAILNTLD